MYSACSAAPAVGAREQINETRKGELEGRRPYVFVTVEPSEASRHLFDLVVRNIGQRPAEIVSIRLDPPPVRAQDTDRHELYKAKMLTEPVAMIAPGQVMRAFYDSHIARNGRDDLPTSHEVLLSYRDSSGHEYKATSVIDIDAMRGTMFTDVKTVHDIGKSLVEIQKTLNNASALHRQGTLDVQASVEPRVERQEWLPRQHSQPRRNEDRRVCGPLANGTDTDETGESA